MQGDTEYELRSWRPPEPIPSILPGTHAIILLCGGLLIAGFDVWARMSGFPFRPIPAHSARWIPGRCDLVSAFTQHWTVVLQRWLVDLRSVARSNSGFRDSPFAFCSDTGVSRINPRFPAVPLGYRSSRHVDRRTPCRDSVK